MNYTILFNLEKKPFKKIEIYFDLKSSIVEVKEIEKDGSEKIIDTKNLHDEVEFEKYLEEFKKNKSAEGFTDSYQMIENIYNLEFIEDDVFGYLIKETDYSANLQTTKYLESFKTTVALSLGTDENFNLYNDVRNTYNFFIENQFDIFKSMMEWFWDEFLELFNDEIEILHRQSGKFDELVELGIKDRKYKSGVRQRFL